VDLFEYQGKRYLAGFGVPVVPGGLASTPDEVVALCSELGCPVVVKAQVRVGGRGKAGGIRLAATAGEARAHAEVVLGMGIGGHIVRNVWVEQATDIAQEYYASFTLDRGAKAHLAMVSAKGGVDIEQVASEEPGAIARVYVDPYEGFSEAQAWHLVDAAGLDEEAEAGVAGVLLSLYRCFVEGDADLVEVNPLVLGRDGCVYALDAKVTLDDNAAFRHPEWDGFAGTAELDERERLARQAGLQYVGLDGFVGIIANGAGLAMSTCDIVNQVGGRPANFLDIGGGASADVMASALEVVSSDMSVRSILINIFGGITRGEEVANGIVAAVGRVDMKVPIIVRLDGTNAEEGRAVLRVAELGTVTTSPSMMGAARLAVELARGHE
jgi:succinyl-CoA synthetase beta subunit